MLDMTKMSPSDFLDENGNFRDIETDPVGKLAFEKLDLLVRIVFCKHFSSASSQMEELISVGKLGALELLKSGAFDPGRSSLKNFLYTRSRNSITNFLYHSRKAYLALEDDLVVLVDKVRPSKEMATATVSALKILRYLQKVKQTKNFKQVLEYLAEMGLSFSDLSNKEVNNQINLTAGITSNQIEKQVAYICWSVL